ERMNYLSNLGFRFSIDDFGTGYSSLSYLRQLPLHELKIDRYFIDEIDLSGAEVPIVNSIIQMAKALNVSVVAEGVENDTQLQYLMEKGCDVYQGYHLSKPLPVEQWLELLSQ
ncbi:MAG: EAL domain-containing protein, partial [Pseudomonadota bacterium]